MPTMGGQLKQQYAWHAIQSLAGLIQDVHQASPNMVPLWSVLARGRYYCNWYTVVVDIQYLLIGPPIFKISTSRHCLDRQHWHTDSSADISIMIWVYCLSCMYKLKCWFQVCVVRHRLQLFQCRLALNSYAHKFKKTSPGQLQSPHC